MPDSIIGKISVGDGATFTPAVDNDGVISWRNNKNLPNPASVDIPQAVMDRYQIAPIASPAFTGNPTAPTQAKTDNSTKLATTAYVQAVVADYLALTGGSITGDVDITGELSVSGAITGNVTGDLTGTASGNLALTGGSITGDVDITGDLSVSGAITGNLTGNADTATNATNDANGNPIAGTYLPLSGGTLKGVVNGVTPPVGDNSTKIATTEFVNAKAENYLPLSGGTLTGAINTANTTWNKLGDDASFGDHNVGGKMCVKSLNWRNPGIAFFNNLDKNVGEVDVNNAFDFNKPVKENGGFLVPIGVVQAFAGSTIPTGWLLCDGSAVSRTDYAALYAVIGTTYGAGNGSTTFNLPNLVDKFVEGSATAGTVKSAGLPNITGTFGRNYTWPDYITANGAVSESHYATNYYPSKQSTESGVSVNYSLDASRSSSVYGNSTTVQPPALTMRYIIKY